MAFPTKTEYVHAFSYWITKLKNEGLMKKLMKQEKKDSQCAAADLGNEGDKLCLKHVSGAYVFVGVGVAVLLIYHCVKKLCKF